jgi:hypothetical protein
LLATGTIGDVVDQPPESGQVHPEGGPGRLDARESEAAQQSVTDQESSFQSTGKPSRRITRPQRIERWFEVITAGMLAVVAVATAWSVYQATRWGGVQSADYAQAAALHVDSTRNATLTGQLRLYDLILTNNWINAHFSGDEQLAAVYQNRLRPEFRPTFEAWLALDPFNNPDAPPGPLFMPGYESSLGNTTEQLDAEAARIFAEGEVAREQGDAYVLNTVFLAMVLFLTTIADRFEWNAARAALLTLGLVMLLIGVYHLTTYPIA